MAREGGRDVTAVIVALPETAGSALYGMVDVRWATGTLWQELVGEEPGPQLIRPRIVSVSRAAFQCGNGIPVMPERDITEPVDADSIILPELWRAPDDDMAGRYPELLDWIRDRHRAGATIYSACSGSVLLAATGLLNGSEATHPSGDRDQFRNSFPGDKSR